MITISNAVQGVIDRIQSCLPVSMKSSVLRFPDKPEQFTPDLLRKSYPGGALLVKHLESGGENGSEILIIGIVIVAVTSLREEKLAEAVRGYLNNYRIWPEQRQNPLIFSADKPLEVELGIIARTVAYRCSRPAVEAKDITAFNQLLNL